MHDIIPKISDPGSWRTDNTDRMSAGRRVLYLGDFSSTLPCEPCPDHQVMLQWVHSRLRLTRLVVLSDLYLNERSIDSTKFFLAE